MARGAWALLRVGMSQVSLVTTDFKDNSGRVPFRRSCLRISFECSQGGTALRPRDKARRHYPHFVVDELI